MDIRNILTVIFLLLGFICFVITAVGVFRLKDFYSRLHAAGVVLCSIGFLIYEGFSVNGLKIFAIFIAVFVASPIGTHIIARVAYKNSIKGIDEDVDESSVAVSSKDKEAK